jgi:Ca-activated chloride channel family protein
MNTTVLLDQEPHAGGHVVRALLRIEGEAPQAADRTPLNLAIVLDRSGSMAGAKIHAAREAAALLVQQLAPEDFVSVVAYDTDVATVAEPSGNAHQLSHLIRAIETGSMTNLSGGWLRGRELAARNVAPKRASRILLLTDGLANVGIQDRDQLAGLCRAAHEEGIRTTTIGFGADYDEVLLGRMAEAGGGHMHYIEHVDQAAAIFREELAGLLSLAAQNLSVTVKPAAATTAVAVHHSYPRSETPDGLKLELGDLYAREPKLVLFEFLVGPGAADPVTIAELTVEAAVIGTDGSVKMQQIAVAISTSLADGPLSNPEVRREQLLLEAARVRTEVLSQQKRGDFDGAAAAMVRMADKLREAGIDDAQVREEAEDLQLMSQQMQAKQWTAMEDKYMYQRAYDSTRAMRSKMEHIARTKRPKPNKDA